MDAYNLTEQCRATMQATTMWRSIVFNGEPKGTLAPPPPIFQVGAVPTYSRGIVTQFFSLRDQIVASAGYTMSIGNDLGIVGPEIVPVNPKELTPDLKALVSMGNFVNLTGSMQGMDALRVEYAPNGGNFATVAFLTKTPGGFQINTKVPNQPEIGRIRAIYIRKNVDFGNFSPDYPVMVA